MNNAWDWAKSEVAWGHTGPDNGVSNTESSIASGAPSSGLGGTITSPKFGTSRNRSGKRVVLAAGVPTQIVISNGNIVRVAIRNVLNNSCIFSESSGISATQYSSALQGASGSEPTAGESDVFETDSDIWALSASGTVLVIDVESV